jgi:hypothetical protein
LEVRKNFFSHRVVEDWNRVPPELKRAGTVKSFKNGYEERNWWEARDEESKNESGTTHAAATR